MDILWYWQTLEIIGGKAFEVDYNLNWTSTCEEK